MILWNSKMCFSDIISLHTDPAPLLGGVKDVIRKPQQIKQKPRPSLPLYLIASNPVGQTHKWDDDTWWLYFETRALMLCLQEGKKSFTLWQFAYNDAVFFLHQMLRQNRFRPFLLFFYFLPFCMSYSSHPPIPLYSSNLLYVLGVAPSVKSLLYSINPYRSHSCIHCHLFSNFHLQLSHNFSPCALYQTPSALQYSF